MTHISNTGMHILSIMVELVRQLNCTPGTIITAINSPENSNQIKCLINLMQLIKADNPNHKRRMWRYGQIFDETFMADLQTKRFPKLVYTLAAALQMEAPITRKDILLIEQLQDVSEDNRRLA